MAACLKSRCLLVSFALPDPTIGKSPDGDDGNFGAAAGGGGEGDALVDDYGGVDGPEGGEHFESADESILVVLLLLPREKSFPYWSRNWQRIWWRANYLLLRSVFSAPKLCGGAVDAAADNDAGWRKRQRLLCHGKYCNNWRWQRPRSRGSAGASCGTGNEDTMELQSIWMLDLYSKILLANAIKYLATQT